MSQQSRTVRPKKHHQFGALNLGAALVGPDVASMGDLSRAQDRDSAIMDGKVLGVVQRNHKMIPIEAAY
ncbi:MAG: hypothetical protein JO166_13910 [Deltaproteobacteria bacterium]|nr:hypothetical protein [Deltaproteobacteria bacterium]